MSNVAEIVKNKDKYIAQKMSQDVTHKACSISFKDSISVKAEGEDSEEGVLTVVINTTNWLDSHLDVHAKGLWDEESLNGLSYVIDHNFSISGLIAQPKDVKASVRRMRWKQLGLDINGTTDALIFEVELKDYANSDFVKAKDAGIPLQNSIRMSYDEIVLCVNDKQYGAEYEAWNKYIKEVHNREDAEKVGYFWYIKKAKARLEGSAVLRGSNPITPILEKKEDEEKQEPITKKAPIWYNLI